jgi:outer membrane protein assembly factor BamB
MKDLVLHFSIKRHQADNKFIVGLLTIAFLLLSFVGFTQSYCTIFPEDLIVRGIAPQGTGNVFVLTTATNQSQMHLVNNTTGNPSFAKHVQDYPEDIIELANGNFVVLDRYGDLVEFDATGTTVSWGAGFIAASGQAVMQSDPTLRSRSFTSLIQTTDGGVLLVGQAKDIAVTRDDFDLHIVKVAPGGTHEWSRTVGVVDIDEQGARAIQTPTGNLVIVGTRTDNSGSSDIYMAAFDEDGGLIPTGSRHFDIANDQYGRDVLYVNDRFYVLASDGHLLSLDANGDLLGTKRISPDQGGVDIVGQRLLPAANNRVFVCGEVRYGANEDIFISLINQFGNVISTEVLGTPSDEHNSQFTLLPDGTLSCAAEIFTSTTNTMFVAKLDAIGFSCCGDDHDFELPGSAAMQVNVGTATDRSRVFWENGWTQTDPYIPGGAFCPSARSVSAEGMEETEILSKSNTLKYYPNPASNELFIEVDQVLEGATVTIFNALGQQVLNTNLTQPKMKLNSSELDPGIYMLHINNGKTAHAGKLIIH